MDSSEIRIRLPTPPPGAWLARRLGKLEAEVAELRLALYGPDVVPDNVVLGEN